MKAAEYVKRYLENKQEILKKTWVGVASSELSGFDAAVKVGIA